MRIPIIFFVIAWLFVALNSWGWHESQELTRRALTGWKQTIEICEKSIASNTWIITNTGEPMFSSPSLQLKQVDLVSSVSGYPAKFDEKMTDAWGAEFGHTNRVWLSNSSGFSTVYDGGGNIVMTKDKEGGEIPLAVKIPVPDGVEEAAPLTGMVFSETDEFSKDSFIFVTEHGTIAGWHKLADGTEPLEATMHVNNYRDGSVYKGAAAAKVRKDWHLFVANFSKNDVEVYDRGYNKAQVNGDFFDPNMPKDYAPFNIKLIKGELYVTYAKQSIDKANDVQGVGNGYINVFDTNGRLQRRLVSNGNLNSPWGLALAPENFGALSNLLLVGNFGDGHILAFDPKTGEEIGMVKDESGKMLQIDGLWALTFGTDNGAGKSNELFFASGPSAEDQGLYGKLLPVTNL